MSLLTTIYDIIKEVGGHKYQHFTEIYQVSRPATFTPSSEFTGEGYIAR
jgi:hypothetical protein